jgi:hypothetical protein
LELVHATELTDFYLRSGYVDYDPGNTMRNLVEVYSYFKDLRPELGTIPYPGAALFLPPALTDVKDA